MKRIVMEIIFGTLSIQGLRSFLEPGNAWLLMAGFPDPNQAGAAATNFIVNVRHLADNTQVAVTGTRNVIGTQPVIIMTDINAAGALMAHAIATPEFQARQATAKKVKAKASGPVSKVKSGRGKRSATPKSSAGQK
jgi:hypothetical protein